MNDKNGCKSCMIWGSGLFICAVVLVAVFPLLCYRPCGHQNANCESNMKQIGTAIKMYLPDWDDTYPMNRTWSAGHKIGPMVSHVKLTPLKKDAKGHYARFKYGADWVEALCPFTEQANAEADPFAVWHCQQISSVDSSKLSRTARTTYAFNQNLCENVEGVIKGSDHLMMVREMDRLGDSELRPINYSTQDPDTPPVSPFLTNADKELGRTKPDLHYNGSHILFADGHVKLFPASFFPSDRVISKHNCWDAKTEQWFNYGPGSNGHVKPAMMESIAITP